ncbi:MAG: hypothetical protein COB78_04715 [Hyphomicrobiales bacterium]|nr:MAG: hypothetical protein COB78_04715 [Hyphomicrobiales bacterium]
MKSFKTLALLALFTLPQAGSALSADFPTTDPLLFKALFSNQQISAEWIEPAARTELTPFMLRNIARDLQKQGGSYSAAQKTARGWLLQFDKGEVRARIIRSKSGYLIGVFFSDIE